MEIYGIILLFPFALLESSRLKIETGGRIFDPKMFLRIADQPFLGDFPLEISGMGKGLGESGRTGYFPETMEHSGKSGANGSFSGIRGMGALNPGALDSGENFPLQGEKFPIFPHSLLPGFGGGSRL